ncbi:MAG: hypothetical protein A2W61_07710 [Deltaproteobacteria bacterium RIFCSPLOWO2_01_44_7]|nr:MAG: hypothetical protein A2712_00350 [Deltaproteobacteria bacterium RIFCSPHIGHO2_01_FULL_43_49]OGQ15867.1 MAG: hypothetical protein A3D22_03000 [Deltaproteobacteria bacterium RIFCSPHIGHO2_02_FULL_44_53]OGQ28821.1 MAG: hypothetical protein A3D98_01330 [Deltaproteobacteria bacterium RIFCSPHIGHO2_12_FULL_44_21]OGQ32141.1 MAG: hypothetical protein A2979_03455 [Deltaproteobacteria bacterium RIFCSPLOWO2_01_FULL_45_74]OGQ43716.1 MAG: hypothetical protein A3I70_05535 [Deltaproteobacteria bacterium 
MIFCLSTLLGLSAGWLFFLFEKRLEQEEWRLKWFATSQELKKEDFLLTFNRRLISVFSPFFKKPLFLKLKIKLDSFLNLSDFLSWSFCLSLEGSLLFLFFFGFSFWNGFLGFLMGFFYPCLWLFLKKRERERKIRRDLPLFMDLLAISVSAGLDIMQAIQRIAKNLPRAELIIELEKTLEDLKMGRSRQEALSALKDRISVSEMKSFVSILLQAMQLGSPLAPVLLANAEQMRVKRFLDVERLGVVASQKILFPLIFCIMPSVFLTIFAPLFIRFFQGGIESFL